MQQVKHFTGLSILFMMIVAGIFAVGSTTEAANFKPYEYKFKTESSKTFFGISGVKNLEITFDKEISNTDAASVKSNIFVVQQVLDGKTAVNEDMKINIVDEVSIANNKLTVTFKNLEYIDYADAKKMEYTLVIKKEAGLYFDQLENFMFPFMIHDVLPGFESVFLNSSAAAVNNLNTVILPENPYRDIFVHVPKFYMTKIETIHRYQGVATDFDDAGDPIGKEGPSLTNIDVQTDPAVSRLKVNFPKVINSQWDRDLERHATFKGFTMGQAGIDGQGASEAKEFTLKAYNQYGRLLEVGNKKIMDLSLKLGVNDLNKPVKYSNYISKVPSDFGKTYSMYTLMASTKTFENILTTLSVEELNTLGITYANQFSTVSVKNAEQLEMALANHKIRTINLTENIMGDVTIKRNVAIIGNGKTIDGNVAIGDNTQDLTVRIKDVTVDGKSTINIGTNGTLVKENVTINRITTVQSAGQNSIHLSAFSTEELVFENTSPVRVVNEDTAITNPLKVPKVTINTQAEIILSGGVYGIVASANPDAKLAVKRSISISDWTVEEGMALTVDYPSSVILPPVKAGVTLNPTDTETDGDDEGGSDAISLGDVTMIYNTGDLPPFEIDFGLQKDIADQVNWETKTPGVTILNKAVGSTIDIQNPQSGTVEVILTGSDTNGIKYKVKLIVIIS